MAGRGQRFLEAGHTLPKPLIPVLGRPMYTWAVDSLPLSLARRLVFVCLEEHLRDHPLEADITTRYGQYDLSIVTVPDITEGQLCTVLAARELLGGNGLVVYNADTWSRTNLGGRLPDLQRDCDGVIGVFEAEGDHWSFARVDGDGRVLETAEKRRISPWATTGLYHFSDSDRFLPDADRMLADGDRVRGEFYVAPLYNRLIAAGADIRVDVAREVGAMGTPEELARFETTHGDG
jgi:NDP-sugar pyrophosphorylase family protein